MDKESVRDRIRAADSAYVLWRQASMSERAACMREAVLILENEKERLAALMATEMGKPIRDGRAEIEKCAWVCRYYAEEAANMLAPEIAPTDARKSYVTFAPLGVILAVMPWNYPFCQVFRFAAPALMAGNAAVLKHASNVPGCARCAWAIPCKRRPRSVPRPALTCGTTCTGRCAAASTRAPAASWEEKSPAARVFASIVLTWQARAAYT